MWHRSIVDADDEESGTGTGTGTGARVDVSPGSGDRVTQCISTQVGCAMGCVFCASGVAGLKRHLGAHEIVAQVLLGKRVLEGREEVRNIVLMGMGEPLHNYEATARALRLMTHPLGMNMSPRRITVSTSGLVPEIARLGQDFGGQIGLAVSLHAADDETRTRLMPVNKKYPLAELMAGAARVSASQATPDLHRVHAGGRQERRPRRGAQGRSPFARSAGQSEPHPDEPHRGIDARRAGDGARLCVSAGAHRQRLHVLRSQASRRRRGRGVRISLAPLLGEPEPRVTAWIGASEPCSPRSSSPTAARLHAAFFAPAAASGSRPWRSTPMPTRARSTSWVRRRSGAHRSAAGQGELPADRSHGRRGEADRRRGDPPGYGLFSEKSSFARAVHDAGLVFIGPASRCSRRARRQDESAPRGQGGGCSPVPGLDEPLPADDAGALELARAHAERIGYPIIIKAVAGGGGIGMQIVETADKLERAYKTAPTALVRPSATGASTSNATCARPSTSRCRGSATARAAR